MKDKNDLNFYAQLVADHSTDSIVITGTDGRVVWANNAFRGLTRYTVEEVRGQKPGDFFAGERNRPDHDRRNQNGA